MRPIYGGRLDQFPNFCGRFHSTKASSKPPPLFIFAVLFPPSPVSSSILVFAQWHNTVLSAYPPYPHTASKTVISADSQLLEDIPGKGAVGRTHPRLQSSRLTLVGDEAEVLGDSNRGHSVGSHPPHLRCLISQSPNYTSQTERKQRIASLIHRHHGFHYEASEESHPTSNQTSRCTTP